MVTEWKTNISPKLENSQKIAWSLSKIGNMNIFGNKRKALYEYNLQSPISRWIIEFISCILQRLHPRVTRPYPDAGRPQIRPIFARNWNLVYCSYWRGNWETCHSKSKSLKLIFRKLLFFSFIFLVVLVHGRVWAMQRRWVGKGVRCWIAVILRRASGKCKLRNKRAMGQEPSW